MKKIVRPLKPSVKAAVKSQTRPKDAAATNTRTRSSNENPTSALPNSVKAIHETVEKTLKDIENVIPAYFKDGEQTIGNLERGIQERLVLLFYTAVARGSNEEGLDKVVPNSKAQALGALCSAARSINYFLVELAKRENEEAVETLWDDCSEMTRAIKMLAMSKPEVLRPKARKSIYLPSFRAKIKKYTDDFQVVSEAIELSKDSAVKTGDDAKFDLDGLITQFAVNLLEEADKKRRFLLQVKNLLDDSAVLRERAFKVLTELGELDLTYLDLSPYGKKTARAWWEICIKPQLESPDLLQKLDNTPLLKSLLATKRNMPKDYIIRNYLKDACKIKILRSLAK